MSEAEIRRYARHIVLRELGGIGQQRLKEASVLVVGAGGLGAPLLLYLAAAGVGRLGVVDDDRVATSNLQRQILFTTGDAERAKVDAAQERLRALNPLVDLVPHEARVTASVVTSLVAAYDLVADGSDNLPTRTLVQDACHLQGKPLVSAAVQGLDGQLTTFQAPSRPAPPLRPLPASRPRSTRRPCPAARKPACSAPPPASWARFRPSRCSRSWSGSAKGCPGGSSSTMLLPPPSTRLRVSRRAECADGCRHLPAAPGTGPRGRDVPAAL